MIYLGEQIEALEWYQSILGCWLRIKLFGKKSAVNPNGYDCGKQNCSICTRKYQKLSSVPFSFTNLISSNLDKIIKSKPDELLKIENDIKSQWVNESGTESEFKNLAERVFECKGYTQWFVKTGINYSLAEHLNQHTCTYCNRQYIFVARKIEGKKGIVCQFDHWYSKKEHPLLALSFYNLIPSCSICNSSIKSDVSFQTATHLHPYLDKDIGSSYKFSYKKIDVSKNEICIANFKNLPEKTRRTLNDFETELVYKGHSSKELQDLIDLRYKYSENYLNILLKKTFGTELKMSDEERYRLIFGIELDDGSFHKRPFSKFKKDIITELLGNT